MKTDTAQYFLAFSVLLFLPCCKGNQQNNGMIMPSIAQVESATEHQEDYKDTDTLSFLANSFEDIPIVDLKWIREIERKFPTKDTLIFWFKYDCPADGYQVTGRFSPVDSECETGRMVMRFDNGKKKFFYQSIWDDENFTCTPILYMSGTDSFKGWENKALYSLHYFKPEDDAFVDNTHPLGFNTPFQFLDINFDGKKELIISDCGMYQGGNRYYTYSVDRDQLKKIVSLPIKEVQTFSAIDSENKTITLNTREGPVGCIIEFKKGQATKEPAFQYPDWVGADIYNEYKNSWRASPFFINSVKLYDSGGVRNL